MIWEKRWFQFAILLITAFIWGSSFILMKVGLKSFSSEQSAAIRIASASIFLLPYSIKHIKALNKSNIFNLMVVGFIGSFIPSFLFTKAQTHIASSMAGMLNTLTPVFTMLVGAVFLKTKYKWINIGGLFIGLAGAIGLLLANNQFSLGKFNVYALLIIVATICYGINVNHVKSKLSHLTGTQVTSLAFLFIGPFALVYLLSTDLSTVPQQPGWLWHLSALLILGIIGTAIALLLMYSLLRYASPVFATSVTYMVPVLAIFWGFIDGEKISFFHILCMIVVLTGVYLINKKPH